MLENRVTKPPRANRDDGRRPLLACCATARKQWNQ